MFFFLSILVLTWLAIESLPNLIITLNQALVLFLSLFLLGFSIATLRNETVWEAVSNRASTILEYVNIITHMFRFYKCFISKWANIKVGMAMYKFS